MIKPAIRCWFFVSGSIIFAFKLSLMNENNKESQIHPNYGKAADLIYLSGALGIGNIIWKYETLDSGLKIFIAVISVGFLFVLGYFISKGTEWLKFFSSYDSIFWNSGITFYYSKSCR